MDPKYVIGVPEMDAQHEKILELADRAKSAGHDEFEINQLVIDLINYSTFHLDHEEAFLKRSGLIDFEREHAKKHAAFRHMAMEFYQKFRESEDSEIKYKLAHEIGVFCEKWLKEHINVEDRTYANLLRRRGT